MTSAQASRWLNKWMAPALSLVIATLVMEILVRAGWVRDFILPAPSQVYGALTQERGELLQAWKQTAFAAFSGLILSFFLGTLLGAALSFSKILRRAFLPYAVFFQTVPVIAIAPLLVIWFGFGLPTVIASSFIVSVFPMITATMMGLQAADSALVDLFRLHSASRWDVFWRLRLPSALPQIRTGLQIAAGLAVVGAVVGEFVGGGGLGSVVDAARTQQRVDIVFAAVLLSAILGLLLLEVVPVTLERLIWLLVTGKIKRRAKN